MVACTAVTEDQDIEVGVRHILSLHDKGVYSTDAIEDKKDWHDVDTVPDKGSAMVLSLRSLPSCLQPCINSARNASPVSLAQPASYTLSCAASPFPSFSRFFRVLLRVSCFVAVEDELEQASRQLPPYSCHSGGKHRA